MAKKKSRKMDRKLVASRQDHEVAVLVKMFKISAKAARGALKVSGRSRVKAYAYLLKKALNGTLKKVK